MNKSDLTPVAITGPTPSTNRSGESSALYALMQLLEAGGPLRVSLEDLTGITFDYEALRLPSHHRQHASPFCQEAKRSINYLPRTSDFRQCVANKYRANDAALHHEHGVTGSCYLGLTDICRPWIYRERVWGIFYFGSVLLHDRERFAQLAIRRACNREHVRPDELLARLEQVPRIDRSELSTYEQRLDAMIRILTPVLDGLGLPTDVYRTFSSAADARDRKASMHPLVMRAMRLIRMHYNEPLRLPHIAEALRCHPGYLGRLFRKHAGCTISEYLQRERITRACRLLRLGQMDVTRIAYEVGFADKSNFGRAFRKQKGMSPGAFQQQQNP